MTRDPATSDRASHLLSSRVTRRRANLNAAGRGLRLPRPGGLPVHLAASLGDSVMLQVALPGTGRLSEPPSQSEPPPAPDRARLRAPGRVRRVGADTTRQSRSDSGLGAESLRHRDTGMLATGRGGGRGPALRLSERPVARRTKSRLSQHWQASR